MALQAVPMHTEPREQSEAARAPMSTLRRSTTTPLSARLIRAALLAALGAGLLLEARPANAAGDDPAAAAAGSADPAPPSAPTLVLSGEYILDLVAVARGDAGEGVRHVDLVTLAGELDLDSALGWRGGRLVAQAIAGTGGQPNALAGTLQGINNVEVPDNAVRLYEFYVSQALADWPVTLRAGFIDLNAEFYRNEAAGLLIAPAFGIGSELAATGPNGPAIFPSTALTATVRVAPTRDTYAAFALVNAEAGVLGEEGGLPPLFAKGALLIGEGGWTGRGKIALGAWRYTRPQEDIRLRDAAGEPLRARAQGAYAVLEWPIGSIAADGTPKASLFLRAGLSDGDTTPYRGGWQAGFLVNRVLPGRPDSQLSAGAKRGILADKFRLEEANLGNPLGAAETGYEITIADRLAPWLSVQANVQYVESASRRPDARDAVVLGLRLAMSFAREI